jgi:hypothetical protein
MKHTFGSLNDVVAVMLSSVLGKFKSGFNSI